MGLLIHKVIYSNEIMGLVHLKIAVLSSVSGFIFTVGESVMVPFNIRPHHKVYFISVGLA